MARGGSEPRARTPQSLPPAAFAQSLPPHRPNDLLGQNCAPESRLRPQAWQTLPPVPAVLDFPVLPVDPILTTRSAAFVARRDLAFWTRGVAHENQVSPAGVCGERAGRCT